MSAFKSITATSVGAALMLSMATPVFAQAAISEPGAYSFYHPDGDVLHTGVQPAPAANAFAMEPYSARVAHHRAHHNSHEFTAKRPDRFGE